LSAVEKTQPDVLIINPSGDGKQQHELLQSITTAAPKVRMLVIATRIDPEYVLDALECGALGYISSSVTMTDLHTAIVNVARGQMYLSPTIKQQDILAKLKPRP
jgi:DNA-binding NarL/FixJ family response regulator